MKAFAIHSSDISRCPKMSFLPRHYREDGTCRCDEEKVPETLVFAGERFHRTAKYPRWRWETANGASLTRHDDLDWRAAYVMEGASLHAAGQSPPEAFRNLCHNIEVLNEMLHQPGKETTK